MTTLLILLALALIWIGLGNPRQSRMASPGAWPARQAVLPGRLDEDKTPVGPAA